MRKQKGQSLVEFALVVPLFLLLLFGIIYSGMFFHDYSSLSNTARSAAREAAIIEGDNYSDIKTYYSNECGKTLTSLYKLKDNGFSITKGDDDAVYVRISMERTLFSAVMNMVLPESFDIVYFMKKDTPASAGN